MNNPMRILVSLTASIFGSVWFSTSVWAWAGGYLRHNSCSGSSAFSGLLCNLARTIQTVWVTGYIMLPLLFMIGVLTVLLHKSLASNPFGRPFQVTLGCGLLVVDALLGVFIFFVYAVQWSAPYVVGGIVWQLVGFALNLGAVMAAASLWRMKERGRQLALAVLLVSTALFFWNGASLFKMGFQLPPFQLFSMLLVPGLRIALLLYLLMPKVRASFIDRANQGQRRSTA